MWKIRKFSLQSGFEHMATRMVDEVLTNWTTEADHDAAGHEFEAQLRSIFLIYHTT